MRLTVVLTLMVAGTAVLSANAFGQPTSAAASDVPLLRTDRTITVHFRGATAADVLTHLGKAAGIEVRFAPGLQATMPITLALRDARIADAFQTVIETAGLSYAMLNDKTVLMAARVIDRGRPSPVSSNRAGTAPEPPPMRFLADQSKRMLLTR